MFCNKCGAEMPENAKYCRSCGAPITEAGQQIAPGQQPRSQQPREGSVMPGQEPRSCAAGEGNVIPGQEPLNYQNQDHQLSQTVYAGDNAAQAPAAQPAPAAKKSKAVPIAVASVLLAAVVVAGGIFGYKALTGNVKKDDDSSKDKSDSAVAEEKEQPESTKPRKVEEPETATTTTTEAATTTTTTATEKERTTTTTTTTTAKKEPAPVAPEVRESDYRTRFNGYDAFLMFADSYWMYGNWSGTGEEEKGFGLDADITGDGTYTVSIASPTIMGPDSRINENVDVDENGLPVPAEGAVVFVVDIVGLCDGSTNYLGEPIENKLSDPASGKNYPNVDKTIKGKYRGDNTDVQVRVTSIRADGEEIPFDPSKIVYGNIEDLNNSFRIEIYNDYGLTAEDPPIDRDSLYFSTLEVTFTITGLGEVGPFDTPSWAK